MSSAGDPSDLGGPALKATTEVLHAWDAADGDGRRAVIRRQGATDSTCARHRPQEQPLSVTLIDQLVHVQDPSGLPRRWCPGRRADALSGPEVVPRGDVLLAAMDVPGRAVDHGEGE